MKERVFLGVAVAALFGGLAVWAMVARRDRPDAELVASVMARPPAPPIGEPIAGDDASAATERRALERAMLGGLPLVRIVERADVGVLGLVLAGRDALGAWERLHEGVGESGRWPLVLGDGWAVRAHENATRTTADTPEAIVRRARSLDLDGWIATRLASSRPREGDWPEEIPDPVPVRSRVVRDALDLPVPEVAVALVPTRDPAEVPAWLAFGNWAGCPEPAVHVAMLARWRERYGAEVVALGADVIELRIARPPTDRDASMALAREQIAYAPELLADGTRSIAQIAASRIGAPTWTLRWPRTSR
ncbi:DUF4253 domain-containing protein [Sandaracinus amylolyticus]|uniref:DUF4253 domain-containing protein n=1 Tax=Sandaracinus amylolyticus TaxID=927083 RepID=A0A0F6YGV3_9BACT|nr:DUF4253 domain-containing protein [Sandaracinus amylolyticus]AKF05110.1 hypothetical protein DB32_002259 [Sandaracinus amylolyticus]